MRGLDRWPGSRITRLAAIVSAFGCCLPLAGQRGPVFTAETELVQVEVRVTDRNSRVVPDLQKDDFELIENGRPQAIATFEYVTRPEATSVAVDSFRGEDRPEPTPAEAASELRRSTFIYVATRGRREDRLRIYEAVKDFVDKSLVPGVLVSIEGSPFTSRRSELHERLQGMLSRASGGRGGASFVDTLAVDLARDDIDYSAELDALIEDTNDEFSEELEEIADRAALYRRVRMYEYIDLIRALSIYPGRKIVVLFSTGLPVDEDNIDIMKVLEDEATKARVRFFVSDVSRLSASAPYGDAEVSGGLEALLGDVENNGFVTQAERRQDNQDGLYALAERTGGRAVLNSNDFGEVFDVVSRETGDYYLLGYYPKDKEQRGRLRRLQVRVRLKGLRVRHQRGYYEQRPFRLMSRSERNLRMHQALTFDTPYSDLPLRADHEFFLDSKGSPTLVYAVGLHTKDIPSESVSKGETVKLTVIAQATARRAENAPPSVPVIDDRRFEMTVDSAALERLSSDPSSWLHYSSQMPLRPGDYDWKVVVRDDLSGTLGSYQTQLRIPPSGSGVAASSLLLTTRIDNIGDRVSAKASRKAPENVLQVEGSRFFATSVKSFSKGDSIFLLYDIYNPDPDLLANPPAPRLALYRGQEPVQVLPVSAHQTVAQPESGRIRHLAALSTVDLAAGGYTVAAMVPNDGKDKTVIFRDFQLVDTASQSPSTGFPQAGGPQPSKQAKTSR